jgi:HSP20 family protein
MALTFRVRHDEPDLFPLEVPRLFRRLVDLDVEPGWLRVEEFVDGDMMVVRAELPDIDPDKDVELTVADGVLHIEARREQRTEQKDKDGYRSELRYGAFARNVHLPPGAKVEDITATYTDGMLEIRAPVQPETAEPGVTRVPITHK